MPNNMNKYGFGNNQDTDNRDWYPTKQEPIKAKLYPYNHIDDLINEKLEQHIQRTDNPHQVTLQQLGADHLFTHNMMVEYDKEKPVIHLILLDLNGKPLSDVGPIDIDVSEYSEEQLEELKRYLEERINIVEEEVKEIIDDLSIEELSKRKVIKVYQKEIDDRWILAETFNPLIVYYEKLIEEEATYYKRIILDEEHFIPNTYYYYKETGINQEQPTTRGLLRANTSITNTEVEKQEGYYPAYKYDENETYYELVYDSNPSISTGIWYFKDDMEVPFYANEQDREAGIPFTMWLWDSGEFYWYDGATKREADLFGVMGYNWIANLPGTGYRYWRSRDEYGRERFGVETAAIGVVFGPRNQGGVGPLGFRTWDSGYFFAGKDMCPHWKDEEMHDELGNNNTVDNFRNMLRGIEGSSWDKGAWKGGSRKIYISRLSTNTMSYEYISRNAVKLSDELLPYGDDNYKTKYVEVEVTPENFESGKYYTYYQTPKEVEEVTTQRMLLSKTFKPNTNYYVIDSIDPVSNKPIYKQIILTESEFYDNYRTDYYKLLIQEDRVEEEDIVRIQLDPKESIYRDYDGNDVLKIVDNNVLINGDPLYPNLTVNSDTYIDKVLETNAEEVYDNKLNGLKLTIPSTAKHGFCSYISFEPNSSFTFNVVNKSRYNLKVIMSGAKTTLYDLVFSEDCQYNLMFLCNGVNVELYIQEILLG